MISSRTPEGWDGRCAVCGLFVRIDPSSTPTRDAPCPHCGTLAWFTEPDEVTIPAEDFATALDDWEAAGRPSKVLLDFSELTHFSSEWLGKLIRLHLQLTATGGRLRVCGLSDDLMDVFRLTRLDQMLHFDDDDPPPEDEELDADDP